MPSLLQRAGVALALIVVALPSGAAQALPCWYPPVTARVTDPFREPACTWCPGNRGLEYGTATGATVRAAATGRVTYSGTIAGTVYVVVRHGDGRRVTYGNLRAASFAIGDLVVRGRVIGRTAGRFHLGVREGDRYVDPAPFVGRLLRSPRLIPVDGRTANPAPPARLACGRSRGARS